MWGLYVEYSINAVDIYLQCGRHTCPGTYASNVECTYSSAPSHHNDCIEFM